MRGWINAHCCVDYRRNFCVPPKSTDVLSSLDPTSKARRPGQSTPNNGWDGNWWRASVDNNDQFLWIVYINVYIVLCHCSAVVVLLPGLFFDPAIFRFNSNCLFFFSLFYLKLEFLHFPNCWENSPSLSLLWFTLADRGRPGSHDDKQKSQTI